MSYKAITNELSRTGESPAGEGSRLLYVAAKVLLESDATDAVDRVSGIASILQSLGASKAHRDGLASTILESMSEKDRVAVIARLPKNQ